MIDRNETYSPTLKTGRKVHNYAKQMFFLSILGIFVSAYLIKNHYDEEKSACDFSGGISCSIVNKSEYSILFNVPVAVFGFCWFLVLSVFGLVLWEGNPTNFRNWDQWTSALLLWTSAGIGFVVYLVAAEIILGAICPFCTVVHVICLVVFWMAYKMTPSPFPNLIQTLWSLRWFILFAAIVHILPLIYFNRPEPNLDSFVRCLRERGIRMFGHNECRVCNAQENLFFDSWKYLDSVDCAEHQDVCASYDIKQYPTWMKLKNGQEIERHIGPYTTNELSAWSGCKKG